MSGNDTGAIASPRGDATSNTSFYDLEEPDGLGPGMVRPGRPLAPPTFWQVHKSQILAGGAVLLAFCLLVALSLWAERRAKRRR